MFNFNSSFGVANISKEADISDFNSSFCAVKVSEEVNIYNLISLLKKKINSTGDILQ